MRASKVIEALIQCHLCNDKLCSKSIISFPVVFLVKRRGDYLVLKTLAVTQFQVHLLFWNFSQILRLLWIFRFLCKLFYSPCKREPDNCIIFCLHLLTASYVSNFLALLSIIYIFLFNTTLCKLKCFCAACVIERFSKSKAVILGFIYKSTFNQAVFLFRVCNILCNSSLFFLAQTQINLVTLVS